MSTTEPKKPRKTRAPRRNFAKEMERLTTYLELIIRVKTSVRDELPEDQTEVIARANGRIDAYTDVQNYLGGK